MEYSMIINNKMSDNKYVYGIKTWSEVTDYLRNKLSTSVIGVHIYKYSSNYHLLGERYVSMCNLVEVATSKSDKNILI